MNTSDCYNSERTLSNKQMKFTFRKEFMKTPLNTLVKSYSSLFPSVLVLFCCPENIMQIIYKQLPIITSDFLIVIQVPIQFGCLIRVF